MPIILWVLIAIIVAAAAAAVYALQLARARRDLVMRLDGQTAAPAEVIVVDQAPADESRRAVASSGLPGVRYIPWEVSA